MEYVKEAVVLSAAIQGNEAKRFGITVRVHDSTKEDLLINGLTGLAELYETKAIVTLAICSAGFKMPNEKIIVEIHQPELTKRGLELAFPIALGILSATGQIDKSFTDNKIFVGELDVDGSVRHVDGTLAFAELAEKEHMSLVTDGSERVPIKSQAHLQCKHLKDALCKTPLPEVKPLDTSLHMEYPYDIDFEDINGHGIAKRAIQIAVAGGHSLILIGPKESEKDELVKRIPTVFPSMTASERLETAKIHSIKGEDYVKICKGMRPLRKPHPSCCLSSLVGGGKPVKPGECSLTHNGVLWLDDLLEFSSAARQSLKQSAKSGRICLTRVDGYYILPSNYMLVASQDATLKALQDEDSINNLRAIAQDVIDMFVTIRPIPSERKSNPRKGCDSSILREGVIAAKEFEKERIKKDGSLDTQEACKMDKWVENEFSEIVKKHNLSENRTLATLKIARTIADMCQSERVNTNHICEALGFALCL